MSVYRSLLKEDDFAGDLGLLEELVGFGGFAKRKLLGDDRLNFAGGEKVEEFGEVFAEPVGALIAEIFDVVPEGVLAGEEFQQAEGGEAEAGGKLPFRDGGAGAIAGERALGAQAAVRSEPVFPTDGIENTVHAVRRELVGAFDEIFGAVINGRGAERGNEGMLPFRSSAEHFEIEDFAKLESGGADTASGTVNEERLAFEHVGEAVKHLVGGDVIEDEADGFGGIEIRGHGDEMGFGNHSELGVAANHGERGDALTEGEVLGARADGVDFTNDVVAGSEGKRRSLWIETVAHEDIGIGNAGGKIFDADLARARRWQIVFDNFENLGATLGRDDDAEIFRSGTWHSDSLKTSVWNGS